MARPRKLDEDQEIITLRVPTSYLRGVRQVFPGYERADGIRRALYFFLRDKAPEVAQAHIEERRSELDALHDYLDRAKTLGFELNEDQVRRIRQRRHMEQTGLGQFTDAHRRAWATASGFTEDQIPLVLNELKKKEAPL